ncbi:MAG: hypothetical protein MJA83_03525, partial [Gammaproteobacteria bacterium]|nr:hypothetical protein [Gammaproteobacteria bacterium]
MLEALPKQKKLQVNQHLSIPDKSRLNALDEIVIFLPETTANRAWPVFPFMELLRERFKNQNHKPDKPFFTRLTNEAGTGVGLAFVDFKTNGFERLSLARKLMDHALHSQPEKIGVLAAGLDAATAARNVEALVAAAHATDFEMPSLKQKKPGRKSLKQIQIFGLGKRVDLKRTEAGAEGNNLARWLTALPGNLLTPALYKKKIA